MMVRSLVFPPFQKYQYYRKENCFKKIFFYFLIYYLMRNYKFQKKRLMVFIEFLLAKSFRKLPFTKNNAFMIKI